MPTIIIDTAIDTTRYLTALKNKGYKTIIRYINPLGFNNEKTVKTAEAKAIAQAGLRLGLVCEGYGGTNNTGIDNISGGRDAAKCIEHAPSVGAPEGACIYYAVDVDADAAYIRNHVIPYFRAIKEGMKLSKYRIGVYGAGATCQAVKENGLADLYWLSCSTGWAGFRDFLSSDQWNMRQHCDVNVAGFGNDTNDVNPNRLDIGDFVPFDLTPVSIPLTPPTELVFPAMITPLQTAKWLQQSLNKLRPYNLTVDGDIGNLTKTAIKKEFYS